MQSNKEPNFFVIGAAKCGTTTLYDFLEQHPEVYMSPIKEPHFFCSDIRIENFSDEYKKYVFSRGINIQEYVAGDMSKKYWEFYIDEFSTYLKLFKNVTNQKAIGEISNGYLFSNVSANEIKSKYPGAKIIIILRNPVERAYSHYLANLRDGRTTLSFREEIEHDLKKEKKGWCISHNYIQMGMYYEQVKRFVDAFPKEQILIFLNDDLKSNAATVGNKLFQFIGVDTSAPINFTNKQNEAKMPKSAGLIKFITQTGLKRKIFRALPQSIQEKIKPFFFKEGSIPKMSAEDKSWLISVFKEDIEKTQALINRDLSNWLK
ncbi:MAG: sulfotransferase domain-containing protein [Bacteroidota bacterium]